jgi:hypothetical protein
MAWEERGFHAAVLYGDSMEGNGKIDKKTKNQILKHGHCRLAWYEAQFSWLNEEIHQWCKQFAFHIIDLILLSAYLLYMIKTGKHH